MKSRTHLENTCYWETQDLWFLSPITRRK